MATDNFSAPPRPPLSLGRHLNFTAGASSQMCNAMLAVDGLTLAQWVVLSALWRQDGLAVGALAAYTGNNLPATSRILGRMIEKGLVRREADATDGRTVRISLTAVGDGLRGLASFPERVNDALLVGFTQAEQDQLFAMLERVEQNARAGIAGLAGAGKPPS